MPGGYRFPRPSKRLRLTPLEPRERQQNSRVMTCRLTEGPSCPAIAGASNVVSPFDLHEGFHGLTRSLYQACRRVPGSTVSSVLFPC